MPPKYNQTITPEEKAEMDAKMILSNWGYHRGDVCDYDNVLDMLKEALLSK